ncbi:MAG: proton-conducting transporter membrane subunit, partial [Clostridia bacterium]
TMFLLGFLGFGVKAAIFPFHSWLPEASIAPTPVTALLHAVAVVKAGAFAVIRMSYYCFGAELVRGSWAQTVCLVVALVSILYGSVMAVREQQIKR